MIARFYGWNSLRFSNAPIFLRFWSLCANRVAGADVQASVIKIFLGNMMEIYFLVIVAIGLSVAMAGAWAIQRVTGLSGWIDTIWSLAVGAGGIAATIVADGSLGRRAIVLVLIALWSLRLASHIGTRTHGSKEDPRYAKLIDEWRDRAALRLFVFLQAQAVAAFVLVLAVYLAAANDEYLLRPLDFLAFAFGFIALGGEAVSDAQLAQFRKSLGAGTGVCELGLWRYSRHPNYFFEWLFWCCFPLFALSGPLWSWLSLIAPIMMYWLLVHVSGIPPLEDYMLRSRGSRFRELQHRVNAFFPGPRRKSSSNLNGDAQ